MEEKNQASHHARVSCTGKPMGTSGPPHLHGKRRANSSSMSYSQPTPISYPAAARSGLNLISHLNRKVHHITAIHHSIPHTARGPTGEDRQGPSSQSTHAWWGKRSWLECSAEASKGIHSAAQGSAAPSSRERQRHTLGHSQQQQYLELTPREHP